LRLKWLLVTITLLLAVIIAPPQQSPAATLQAPAPALFFSDLINGPATGNSDSTFTANGGAYVTIYGNFLTGGTITLNGASCLTVVSAPSTWLWYQRMIVQLTGTCSTGNFVVTTSAGTSNSLPFTVSSGKIYYVATSGNDSKPGTFASPWRTLPHAVQTAGQKPGSIVYAEGNVQQLVDDGQWNSALTLRNGWCKGTAVQPDALIGYPGVRGIQIGPNSRATSGLATTDFTAGEGACAGHWVIAELVMRGASALQLRGGDTWRVIGNDVACPFAAGGGGGSSCLGTGFTTNIKVFGNNFHDMSPTSTDRLQQGVYYSSDSNHVEHGWNLHNNSGGRASLQTHSSPVSAGNGFILFDYKIHDNIIHDSREECILIDTMDPSKGPVEIWNNVLYNCGKDGSGDSLHHQLSGDFDASHGLGASPPPIRWYNNTVLVTSAGSSCWGSSYPDIHSGLTTTNFLQNNLCYVVGTAPYWQPSAYFGNVCSNSDSISACQSMSGTVNLVFGNGSPTYPNLMTNQINSNPLLVNPVVLGCPAACVTDLHLLSLGSPAISRGSATAPVPTYDIEGKLRSLPPSIGAYEYNAGTIAAKPNPPTNLTVVIN
jgi:hypothetical protein